MMGSLLSARARRNTVLSAILVVGMTTGISWAATTGKIAGRVIEEESGQPIPGVAVVIEGLQMGATTDPDGHYYVIGVPPGAHSVRAAMIGYTSLTKTQVIVNIDRTTQIDYELSQSAIEVSGVTVVAEREVIKLDVGSSQASLTAEDVLALPSMTSLASAIAREPGTDGSTIRGGLVDETQLLINGHYMTDVRLNKTEVNTIPVTSVQEVQVLKSGFNAEYGNVRSGVINVVTRDDARRYWFNSRSVYTPAQKKHWTEDAYGNSWPSAYGPDTREWQIYATEASILDTIALPVLSTPDDPNDLDTLFTGWIKTIPPFLPYDIRLDIAQRKQQYYAHRHGFTEDDYANEADYNFDLSFGGPVPLANGLSFTYSHRNARSLYMLASTRPAATAFTHLLGMTYRMGPAKLTLTGAYNEDSGVVGGSMTSYNKYAIYRGSPSDNKGFNGGATFTHVLSTATQYELTFDYQSRDYTMGIWPKRKLLTGEFNPLFDEHNILTAGLTTDTTGWIDVNPNDPFGIAPYGHQGSNLDSRDEGSAVIGTSYNFGAGTTNLDSSYWNAYRVRGFVLSQLTPNHQLKAGFEWSVRNLHERTIEASIRNNQYSYFNQSPLAISGYLQDKIEYEGMILNLGLRLDHFNSQANVYNRDDLYSGIWRKDYAWPHQTDHDHYHWLDTNAVNSDIPVIIEPAKTHTKLSPRLSMSHPITDASKVFFNYGRFYQEPITLHLYDYQYNPSGTGIGPKANADLEMPRTIMYELGVEREFTNWLYAGLFGWRVEPQYLLSVAGYYKDITGEVEQKGYYLTYTDLQWTWGNKGYAQIRGVEVRFQKRIGRFFTGWFQGDFSLRDEGKVGNAREDELGLQIWREEAYQVTSVAEPVWSLYLDLHTPRGFDPLGLPPAVGELWALTFDMRYSQGAQGVYNPNSESPPPPLNIRSRDNWVSSLSLGKGFSFGGVIGEVSMTIDNVLGHRILWQGSMTETEQRNYMKSLHFPIEDGAIETDPGDDRVGDFPEYAVIPTHDGWAHFLNPRTVRFSLNLSVN